MAYRYKDNLFLSAVLFAPGQICLCFAFRLMKFLNIPFIPKSLSTFFNGKIFENIEYREKESKSRADMIQLLLDARKSHPDKCI